MKEISPTIYWPDLIMCFPPNNLFFHPDLLQKILIGLWNHWTLLLRSLSCWNINLKLLPFIKTLAHLIVQIVFHIFVDRDVKSTISFIIWIWRCIKRMIIRRWWECTKVSSSDGDVAGPSRSEQVTSTPVILLASLRVRS